MSSIVKVDTIQENTSANGITVDGLNIKDSKLTTSNSVVAANITADAVDATKIADDAISEEHLDVTAITGHSAETSVATDDLILISDTSASGALKKMTRANFVSGVGETNTPMFFVSGGNQTISHNSNTKMTISSESFDTDSCFDLGSNNRFTPDKAGKYFFTLSLFSPSTDDIDYWTANVKKNGGSGGGFSGVQRNYNNVCYNGILTANGSGDYFEAFCEQESGSNRTIAVSEFSAFYIGN
jgi:hypothetical protein